MGVLLERLESWFKFCFLENLLLELESTLESSAEELSASDVLRGFNVLVLAVLFLKLMYMISLLIKITIQFVILLSRYLKMFSKKCSLPQLLLFSFFKSGFIGFIY